MGRFAVFHVTRDSGNSAKADKVAPILYSKNADEVRISRPLKSFLTSEDVKKERFYMNKICDRVINGKPFLNSVLAEQDELESTNQSKFIEFKMSEQVRKDGEGLAKE